MPCGASHPRGSTHPLNFVRCGLGFFPLLVNVCGDLFDAGVWRVLVGVAMRLACALLRLPGRLVGLLLALLFLSAVLLGPATPFYGHDCFPRYVSFSSVSMPCPDLRCDLMLSSHARNFRDVVQSAAFWCHPGCRSSSSLSGWFFCGMASGMKGSRMKARVKVVELEAQWRGGGEVCDLSLNHRPQSPPRTQKIGEHKKGK